MMLAIVDEIRPLVADLPSYDYRRVWGLLRSERELRCKAPVNAKRVRCWHRELA
jgi:hypothetical protein